MRVINDGRGFSRAGGTIMGEAKSEMLGLRTVENPARNISRMLKDGASVKS